MLEGFAQGHTADEAHAWWAEQAAGCSGLQVLRASQGRTSAPPLPYSLLTGLAPPRRQELRMPRPALSSRNLTKATTLNTGPTNG